MIEIDTPEYYKIIIDAYVESSKNNKISFNPIIMYKIIENFTYLKTIGVTPSLNFYNLLYLEMEYQEKNGFLITPLLQKIIYNHRKNNFSSFLTNYGELLYMNIARQNLI